MKKGTDRLLRARREAQRARRKDRESHRLYQEGVGVGTYRVLVTVFHQRTTTTGGLLLSVYFPGDSTRHDFVLIEEQLQHLLLNYPQQSLDKIPLSDFNHLVRQLYIRSGPVVKLRLKAPLEPGECIYHHVKKCGGTSLLLQVYVTNTQELILRAHSPSYVYYF